MQGKNHVALALAAPLAAAALGYPDVLPPTAAAWVGLALGSLAPDIDGEGSIARLGSWLPAPITPKPLIAFLNGLGRTISSTIRAPLAVVGHSFGFCWL